MDTLLCLHGIGDKPHFQAVWIYLRPCHTKRKFQGCIEPQIDRGYVPLRVWITQFKLGAGILEICFGVPV